MPRPIDPALLQAPVEGVHLRPGTLADQFAAAGRPTLLVFLRHCGCPFSREVVAEVREAAESDAHYPAVLFVEMAGPADVAEFFSGRWPAARAIADPGAALYRGFGVPRGGLTQMLAPGVWACGLRATLKGHRAGKPIGDPWQMPAFFLLDGGEIVWEHRSRHAADHPDFARIGALATA